MSLRARPLTAATWPAFARLVEKHHGIFGWCWCISFHLQEGEGRRGAAAYRAMKEARVRSGTAHAAMIFDGPDAVGWCQYGSVDELPNIKSRKAYDAGLTELPDWRITCFFIDRERRGEGIANLALHHALAEIGRLGGGTVEGYPEDVAGRKVSRSFLWSGTLGMFEKEGFRPTRQIGMHRWVVVRTVPPQGAGRKAGAGPRLRAHPSSGARKRADSRRAQPGAPGTEITRGTPWKAR